MTTDYISIIQPFAATNYVLNASFEYWSAGPVPTLWNNVGAATLSADTTRTWRGAYSCKVVSASGYKGISQAVASGNTAQILSAHVYVEAGTVALCAYDYDLASNPVTVDSVGTGWQWMQVAKTGAGGGVGVRFHSKNMAATYYVDAVQLEDGSIATTYIDGDQKDCYWNGTPYFSTSTRDGQSREGGKIVPLNTLCDGMIDLLGAGMPPFNNVSMPFGLVGGSIHQRTTKQARVFTISFLLSGTSLDNLHAKFRAIEDLIKYDAVTPEQPVKLLYNDLISSTTLTIHAVYDGGMEGQTIEGADNHLYQTMAIRFLADDPCWYADKQSAQVLGYQQTVANANYILQRRTGVWSALNYGLDGPAQCMVFGSNGSLYAGGTFTHCGNAAAGDLAAAHIAQWTGAAWAALGAGCNNWVYSMAFDAAGNLYAGVQFTQAGGVADTAYVAKWDGSNWSALGTGTNGLVRAVCMDRSGNMYIGGDFALAGGVANTVRIAKWNGTAWAPLGTGCNGSVNALVCGPDGYIYAAGTFTTANGVTCNGIAKWNGTTFVPLAGGVTAGFSSVNDIKFGVDGRLYIAGDFSAVGGVSCSEIAVWNGTGWAPLGAGLDNTPNNIAVAQNGNIYAFGLFHSAGGMALVDSAAYWTGSSWLPLDVTDPSPWANYCGFFDPRGNLYISFNSSGSATSATVTIPTNASTKSYPWFKIYHYNAATGAAAQIYQLVNYTIGRSIYFNNLQVLSGEAIWLQLKPGEVNMWSSVRGLLNNYILGGSNLDFYLQPGINNISAYLVGGVAGVSSIHMYWNGTFWSNSGVA